MEYMIYRFNYPAIFGGGASTILKDGMFSSDDIKFQASWEEIVIIHQKINDFLKCCIEYSKLDFLNTDTTKSNSNAVAFTTADNLPFVKFNNNPYLRNGSIKAYLIPPIELGGGVLRVVTYNEGFYPLNPIRPVQGRWIIVVTKPGFSAILEKYNDKNGFVISVDISPEDIGVFGDYRINNSNPSVLTENRLPKCNIEKCFTVCTSDNKKVESTLTTLKNINRINILITTLKESHYNKHAIVLQELYNKDTFHLKMLRDTDALLANKLFEKYGPIVVGFENFEGVINPCHRDFTKAFKSHNLKGLELHHNGECKCDTKPVTVMYIDTTRKITLNDEPIRILGLCENENIEEYARTTYNVKSIIPGKEDRIPRIFRYKSGKQAELTDILVTKATYSIMLYETGQRDKLEHINLARQLIVPEKRRFVNQVVGNPYYLNYSEQLVNFIRTIITCDSTLHLEENFKDFKTKYYYK